MEQLPHGRPTGGPAAPGGVGLWSIRARVDPSIAQQLHVWPSGRSTRQTLRSPCSQATPLEAYCWASRSRGGPRVYATPQGRPTRGPSAPECPLVDQPLHWLPTGGPATPGIANQWTITDAPPHTDCCWGPSEYRFLVAEHPKMDPLVAWRSFASQLRCVALSLIAIALAAHWHCIGLALASPCNFIALQIALRCVALRCDRIVTRVALRCVAIASRSVALHRVALHCVALHCIAFALH